ncbi:MAG: tripartite tricarboxylate transporter substrate binding protein [Variovorax sp.]|nr:MAG: tripartite tricarboxylate transporter substrate binding protein [Variovorax sp.]
MSMQRRHAITRIALAGAMLPALPLHAAPASWPQRPVRLQVVYPPGGLSDATARTLADLLAPSLGVPVLVEHRPGAGGSLGLDALARAVPDGHTLAFSAITPLTLRPLLSRTARAPMRGVVPVASVMHTPVLVVATPAFAGQRFEDLTALAIARPGALRWATSGVATAGHMVMAQVQVCIGARITHVPYQGGGAQLNDALGGQFELLSTNLAAQQLGYVKSGRLRALAVGAPSRIDVMPDAPTLAELGCGDANLGSLFGVFAPAHTPAAVVARLNTEINRALQSSVMRARLRESHNLVAGGTPADFQAEIDADLKRNRRLIAGAREQFE